MSGVLDGMAVGAAEPARLGERLEVIRCVGHAAADAGDVAVETGDLPLVGVRDVPHEREVGVEPLKAAEFRAAVGSGAGFDVGKGLLVETTEGGRVLAPVELRRGGSRWRRCSAEERRIASVRTSTGVGGGRWPWPVVAASVTTQTRVVVPAAGHADVEVLGGGGVVGEEHGPVDGDALGFVDGDGVGEGDVLGDVVGGEDDAAVAVEVGDDQGAVVPAGVDLPAVAVADPQAAGGDEAAVVAGGDDLVAHGRRPGPPIGTPVGFDLAGGDPARPGRAGRERRRWRGRWPRRRSTRRPPGRPASWVKASSSISSRVPPMMRPWAS